MELPFGHIKDSWKLYVVGDFLFTSLIDYRLKNFFIVKNGRLQKIGKMKRRFLERQLPLLVTTSFMEIGIRRVVLVNLISLYVDIHEKCIRYKWCTIGSSVRFLNCLQRTHGF